MFTVPSSQRSPQSRRSTSALGVRAFKHVAVFVGTTTVLAACSGSLITRSAPTATAPTAARTPTPTRTPIPTPTRTLTTALSIVSPAQGSQTLAASVLVSGTSTPGAGITIGDGTLSKRIVATTGRWRLRMHLAIGDNPLLVVATKVGYEAGSFNWNVTRTLTPAQVAARKAADEARAVAAKATAQARVQRAEANFKASASTISYADLLGDSRPFVGKHVFFRGQILQIRQNRKAGGIMLLSVTYLGSGVWTDNLWVNYDSATTATKTNDITIYGTVTGIKSYAAQAGGNTRMPEIHARYIDLTG